MNFKETSSKERAERDKDKLKRDGESIITDLFDRILVISEVAIEPQRYKPFRSMVLREGNNAIRDFKKVLDTYYEVKFSPTTEDIIEVRRPSVRNFKD